MVLLLCVVAVKSLHSQTLGKKFSVVNFSESKYFFFGCYTLSNLKTFIKRREAVERACCR